MGTALQRIPLFHSLRVQLLVGTVIIITATSVLSGWLTTISVTQRFERFLLQSSEARDLFVEKIGQNTALADVGSGMIVEIQYTEMNSGIQQEFLNSVTKVILAVVAGAGFIALSLVALLVVPRLLAIEDITQAARSLADGNLDRRVKVKASDEISALAQSFNDMADSLEKVERLRRRMVNDVAHELRTPLSNIQGYMEGLRDGVIMPRPELFDSLYQEAQHLTRLVNDLQILSLAEAGQLNLRREFAHIQPLIESVVSQLNETRPNSAYIEQDIADNLPNILIDPDRIRQVLTNLLANAIEYTPASGHIYLKAIRDETVVRVSVTDTGGGIAPQHLPYVFERFYRADASRTRTTGGSGVGLAIVKQLVTSHGGEVSVISEVGEGSTFTFTLPISIPQLG